MLELDLCDLSKYYKDENAAQKLSRIPSSTEDIKIIGSLTGSRLLDLSSLNSCDLNTIASINIIFFYIYTPTGSKRAGLVIQDGAFLPIPISGSNTSWITQHGEYIIDSLYTIDSISTNTFIQLSGANMYSSSLSAREILINNGAITSPTLNCNTLSLNNVNENSSAFIKRANIECSKFIADIPKARIDLSSIIASTEYKHISGDISVLNSNITSPNIVINDGYLLDSVINFNTLHISGGNISANCFYDESLGNSGVAIIASGSNTDAKFLLECPTLIIDNRSGWLQGTFNVKLVSGLQPDMYLGLSGIMITEESVIYDIYNSGELQIGYAYSAQNINNYNKLTIDNISGNLSGNGNRIFLYQTRGAQSTFNEPYLKLRGLWNFSRIRCQDLNTNSIYKTDINDGTIEARNVDINTITNDISGIIQSTNELKLKNSKNYGAIFADNIELDNTENYGMAKGTKVLFYNSKNFDDANIINDAIFDYRPGNTTRPINSGLLNNASFYSGSFNFGSGNNLNFYDISQNRGNISGHNQINFYNFSSNYGYIIDKVKFYNNTINSGGIYKGNFYNRSSNDEAAALSNFYDHTKNTRYANGCSFYDFATNTTGLSQQSSAFLCNFFDQTNNNGPLLSGMFYNDSVNYSSNADNCSFFDNSRNLGLAIFPSFYDNSTNLATGIAAYFKETINSGLCLGTPPGQLYLATTVFEGKKALNLNECRDGKVFFMQGASNGEIIVIEDFWSSGVSANFMRSGPRITLATGISFFESSKNLGNITLSNNIWFSGNAANLGNILGCETVRFTRSTNGPPLLDYIAQHPYYRYTSISDCATVIFEENSSNQQLLSFCQNIIFDNNSTNEYVIPQAYEVQFKNGSSNRAAYVAGDHIVFSGASNDFGNMIPYVSISFFRSNNTIDVNCGDIKFKESSANYAHVSGSHIVFDLSDNFNKLHSFSSFNAYVSDNLGTIDVSSALSTFSYFRNFGTIFGKTSYYYEDNNPIPQRSNAITFEHSLNSGTISGAYVFFTNGSYNYGTVIGEASFDASSFNFGIVSGELGWLQ